ncbi:EthD domain-containing protein [Novosphingobium cyanobacteriorum]|uniref:EthD domain-containing protein n=1 Tax=Novosphingobium cyanobacteriorum TaxID=3024215 RepID=A0ABT6CN20_9SPHN|nr:EthD domain-containing protein [Novosphingobium cyanobacteriorum]MDF8335320.1 EthD domain-containing protein [Novosphingobium cyanobacteriorum]
MSETHLLLFAPECAAPAAWAAALRQALPQGATLALALAAEALPALAHAAQRDAEVPDALVRLPDGADAAALVALSDADRSEAFTGVRHAVLPGGDAIRLFFGLHRLERLSRAEFHDYWLNRHAQIGRRLIPPYTYHQIHACDGPDLEGLRRSTFDGIVEVHFPDAEALVKQLSRSEVAEEALADERNFIDHARSRFWAFTEVA